MKDSIQNENQLGYAVDKSIETEQSAKSSNRSFTVESSSQTSPVNVESGTVDKEDAAVRIGDNDFVPQVTEEERKKLDEQLRNV
jgi:hypothetical protein